MAKRIGDKGRWRRVVRAAKYALEGDCADVTWHDANADTRWHYYILATCAPDIFSVEFAKSLPRGWAHCLTAGAQ